MKKVTAIIISITLIVLLGLSIFNIYTSTKETSPTIVNGLLDLSEKDLGDNEVIPLNGEWEFYPGELLNLKDINNLKSSTYIKVPSAIKEYGTSSKSPFGIATLRARILVKDANAIYGARTSIIRISNQMLINGKLAGNSGKPATTKKDYIPENTPYTVYFETDNNVIDIIIQTSNFEYATGGGINKPILFGTQKAIANVTSSMIANDFIKVASFLIMAFYFIGLYFLRKNNIKTNQSYLLYFGLFCFSFALYDATQSQKVFYMIWPNIDYYTFSFIQRMAVPLSSCSLVNYMCSMFKEYTSRKVLYVFYFVSSLLLVSIVILPPSMHTVYADTLASVLAVSASLFGIYVILLGIMARVEGSRFLLISGLGIVVFIISETLNIHGFSNISLKIPYEPFIFILSQAFFHAKDLIRYHIGLEKMSHDLNEANALKDELIAKMSYELQTPLQGVITTLDYLADEVKYADNIELGENLHIAGTMAKRLTNIINDLLDVTSLNRGAIELEMVSVNIYDIINAVSAIIEEIYRYKEIKIVNNIERSKSFIKGDEDKVKQIMFNLIDFSVKNTVSGQVCITSHLKDDVLQILINNDAKFLSHKQVYELFNAELKTDDHSSDINYDISLGIAKKLIEYLGGKIDVYSQIDKGTSFIVDLQALADEQHIQHKEIAVSNLTAIKSPYITNKNGEYNVLVVSHDYLEMKILVDLLAKDNYRVIAVNNKEDALTQIFTKERIDILILDLPLSKNNFQLCHEVRRVYRVTELPILMLTAAYYPGDIVAAFEAGVNDFLNKPFNKTNLEVRVKSLIMMKESADKAKDMENAYLAAQIKPHFLYNTLNTVVALSYINLEQSRDLIGSLAEFLRGRFSYKTANHLIPLSQEVEMVKTYLEIEKVRFSDRLTIDYQIENAKNYMIPPLTIQTLVENAIKHGIKDKENGGVVSIKICEEGSHCKIVIEDNGLGISKEKVHDLMQLDNNLTGLGIKNVNKRLILLQNEPIKIESEVNKGTKIIIKIKKN